MVTPGTPGASSPKKLNLCDSEDSSGMFKKAASPCQTLESIPPALPSESEKLENLKMLDSAMAEAEQYMTNEGCVTLVKSEEMEMVTSGDSHQVPGEWADLEKFVIRVKGRGQRHKRFQCSLCGKLMEGKKKCLGHVEAKHFRELFTHTCDVCQKTFKTKAILTTHIKRIHN